MTDWFTIAAIVIGPLSAVGGTMWLQHRKELRERQLDVFRTLMRTRRIPLTAEHVGALNLIEIEFHNVPKVLTPFKELMRHLGTAQPRLESEQVTDSMKEQEKISRNNSFWRRLQDERSRLLARLLHAMGNQVGLKTEQLEIFEGGYTPQGWEDDLTEARLIRRYITDLYHGYRVLPVGLIDYRQSTLTPKSPLEAALSGSVDTKQT
jgi:hypothetical protein